MSAALKESHPTWNGRREFRDRGLRSSARRVRREACEHAVRFPAVLWCRTGSQDPRVIRGRPPDESPPDTVLLIQVSFNSYSIYQ
jgi:hypothetical protein